MIFGGGNDSHVRNMVNQLDRQVRAQQKQIDTLQRQMRELQVRLADAVEALDRVDGVT